ncbi:MAG: hypothetical protein D3904_14885 [Candidatus Electrothrix sp. EH2]|nr:hypothetical protein [Candidatus Electrothrix sp. EH2]
MGEPFNHSHFHTCTVQGFSHFDAGQSTADRMSRRLCATGMEIHTDDSAEEILVTDDGRAKAVRLASGKRVAADMVLLMVGVQPNVEFLAGSGIAVDQAVLTDREMRTSVPDIYAAGDMVQIHDPVLDKDVVSALWGNAVHMGRTAGFNMSGIKAFVPPLLSSFNSTEIAGLPIISAGLLHRQSKQSASGRYAVYTEARGENYRKLVFEQDRLAGMIFVGNINRAGVYTNLIRNRIPLGERRDAVIREIMEAI